MNPAAGHGADRQLPYVGIARAVVPLHAVMGRDVESYRGTRTHSMPLSPSSYVVYTPYSRNLRTTTYHHTQYVPHEPDATPSSVCAIKHYCILDGLHAWRFLKRQATNSLVLLRSRRHIPTNQPERWCTVKYPRRFEYGVVSSIQLTALAASFHLPECTE